MAIKWKSFRYSSLGKGLALLLGLITFVAMCNSFAWLAMRSFEFSKDDYFETSSFQNRFINDVQRVIDQATLYRNAEKRKIEQEKANGNQPILSETGENLDNVRNYLDDEQLYQFNLNLQYLKTNQNFLFDIRKKDGTLVIQNQALRGNEALLDRARFEMEWTDLTLKSSGTVSSNLTETLLHLLIYSQLSDFNIRFGIRDVMEYGDPYFHDYHQFQVTEEAMETVLGLLILSAILFIILLFNIISVSGRREPKGLIKLLFYDYLPVEISTCLALFFLFVFCTPIVSNYQSDASFIPFITAFSSCIYIVGALWVLSNVRLMKAGVWKKHTITWQIFHMLSGLLKLLFRTGPITWIGTSFLVGWVLIDLGLVIFLMNSRRVGIIIVAVLFLVFNATVLWMVINTLSSFSRISKGLSDMRNGNLDMTFHLPQLPAPVATMAQNIDDIQRGMKEAVSSAIRSERMRTELITNVSHDLKTPLTSIISYVDLLRQEVEPGSKADEYVTVLASKSERLKTLIDDLLEATKASSGNLPVSLQPIQMNALVRQVLGEFEDRIAEKELDIRFSEVDGVPHVLADSNHLGRVMENITSNLVKYALQGSRVYISLSGDEHYVCLTIKNISSSPLDIPTEQLMERFVRGEKARTGDGSGLGLSIAENLIQLMHGKFSIEIDGDLFKTIICLPCSA